MQGDTLRRVLGRVGGGLLDKAALVLPMMLLGVLVLAAAMGPPRSPDDARVRLVAGEMTLSRTDGRPGDAVTMYFESSCGSVYWDGKPVPADDHPGGEFCTSYTFAVPGDAAARTHQVSLGAGSPVVNFTVWPGPRIEVDRTAQPGQRAFIHYLTHESCAASITFDGTVVLPKLEWGYHSGDFLIPAGADPSLGHKLLMMCGGKAVASAPMKVEAPPAPPPGEEEPSRPPPPPPPPVVTEPRPADPVPVVPGAPRPQPGDTATPPANNPGASVVPVPPPASATTTPPPGVVAPPKPGPSSVPAPSQVDVTAWVAGPPAGAAAGASRPPDAKAGRDNPSGTGQDGPDLAVTAGRPGETAQATATGLPSGCIADPGPRVELGGRTLGFVRTAPPTPGLTGANWQAVVRLPTDARVGAHKMTLSCGGQDVVKTSYHVDGSALESELATSVAAPDRLNLTPGTIALTAAGVLVLLLVARFPAELFNKTYEEHRDVIDAKLAPIRAPFVAAGTLVPQRARVVVAFAATAVLFACVEPGSGLNGRTVVLTLQLGLVLLLMWLTYQHAGELHARRVSGVRGPLHVAGAAFVVAAVCVAVSRAAHLIPGYVYGIVVVYAVTRQGVARWNSRREAGAILIGVWLTLAVAVAAWFARTPLQEALGARSGAGQLAAGLLTLVFVAGVETVVFGLMPLRFLDGHKLRERGRLLWGVPFLLATVLFVHVLVTEYVTAVPTGQAIRALTGILVLILGFGLLSVAFWGYFLHYDRRRGMPARPVTTIR